MTELHHSALEERHAALGARLVPFGGWLMPLQYEGVVAEHRACRSGAVVFDVSHLGSVRVEGVGAFDRLQVVLSNDLDRVEVGQTQYTHLLNDAGGVVDDLIVWRIASDAFMVMPNASNTDRVIAALLGSSSRIASTAEASTAESARAGAASVNMPEARTGVADDVSVVDVTAERSMLAVQGPQARKLLARVWPEAAAVERNHSSALAFQGFQALVAGTGYTGESGVEIHIDNAGAGGLFDALLDVSIAPAGLGARDTLRLEKGYPLHGHELGPDITPLEAGLDFVVAWDKPSFVGKDALLEQRESGVDSKLVGLKLADRKIARQGAAVLRNGKVIGCVTSGNFSPQLDVAIALAFVEPDIAEGALLDIDIRGRVTQATVVPTPFV